MSDNSRRIEEAAEWIGKGRAAIDVFVDGKQTRLEEALAAFREAARLDPRNFEAYYLQGTIHIRFRRWAEAETALRQAIAIDPHGTDAALKLADVLASQDRHAECLAQLRMVCSDNPAYGEAWFHLGHYLLYGGRVEEALASLLRAAELMPGNRTVLHHLAIAHLGGGRFDAALHALRRMKELAPDYAVRRERSREANARGAALLERRQLPQALAEFRRALSFDIDNIEAHRNAAACVRPVSERSDADRPVAPLLAALPAEREFAELFNMYYCWLSGSGKKTLHLKWFGRVCQKTPGDVWAYQEIIHETEPDLLIECGSFQGGSALYFASLFELLGKGRVVSIDVEAVSTRPQHPRIHYLAGSSTAAAVLDEVRRHVPRQGKTMVVLDSDHSRDHVLAELRAYAPLVSPGCYLVVEDTVINFHPAWNVWYRDSEGPTEAIMAFLKENDEFHIDKTRERYLVSVCPNGFLRKL